MLSLRLFDTFVLSTELMQLLIRKLEGKRSVENRKIPYQVGISITSKVKEPTSSGLSHKALIVTPKWC